MLHVYVIARTRLYEILVVIDMSWCHVIIMILQDKAVQIAYVNSLTKKNTLSVIDLECKSKSKCHKENIPSI